MFVSIALMARRLSALFSCKMHGTLSDELNLFSAEFVTPETIPQNDRIYLLDLRKNEEILFNRSFAVLAVIGKPEEKLIDRCGCVLEFSDAEAPETVFNAINGVFVFYNQWDYKLQQIIKSQGTLQNLIDCSVPIFRNTLAMHNAALECIAETNEVLETEDYATHLQASAQRLKLSYQRIFLEDCDYQKSLLLEGPFFSKITGHRTLTQNLFVDGEFFCRIVIPEKKNPLYSTDLNLLQHLSGYIQLLLSKHIVNSIEDVQSFNLFLSNILSGKMNDETYIHKKIREHGWQYNDHYLCLKFTTDSFNKLENTSEVICRHFKKLIKRSEIFKYQDSILAIVNMGQEPYDSFIVVQSFSEYMRDMNMKVGVSNTICGFNNLLYIHKQAELALRIGLRLWKDKWIQRFSSVAPYYLLEQSMSEMPVVAVCPSEIIELLRYDASHKTEYYHTVKAYLECDLHLVETAKRLYIHRTTLIYRLKKITQYFKLCFNNSFVIMYYRFSINLITYTGFDIEINQRN